MKPAQQLPRWMRSQVLSLGQKPPQSGPALLQHPPPPACAVSTWKLWAQALNLASFCGPQPGLNTPGSH